MKKQKVKLWIIFPLVALMARAPGTKDQCMITLIALVGSLAAWGFLIAGAVKVIA